MQPKSPNLFYLKKNLIGANRFVLSIIVFEKIGVKFQVRIRHNFNFFYTAVALLCYYTRQGRSKKI